MYLADIYTVTADLAGIPGISIPCGQTREKLPIGLQILGRHFDEATILRVAHAYEQAVSPSIELPVIGTNESIQSEWPQ